MKIARLHLSNFRSHKDSALDLSPGLTFVGGLNGVGKSTLLDGIAMALTGTCRGAQSGRGLADLRGHGKGKWKLKLQLLQSRGKKEDSHLIDRTEGEGPRSQIQNVVDTVLGLPGSVIRACLYSGELFRLDRKDAQKLLLGLVGDETVEVPEEARGYLLARNATASEITAAYNEVYEERRALGKSLRILGQSVDPPEPPEGLGLDGKALGEIQAVCTAIRKKTASLETEAAEMGALIESADLKPADLASRIQGLEAGAQEMVDGLKEAEGLEERVATASKALKAAERKRKLAKEYQKNASGLVGALETAQAESSRLLNLPEVCPTCDGKMSEPRRIRLGLASEQALNQAQAALDKLGPEPVGANVEPLVKTLESLEREEASAAEMREDHKKITRLIADAREELEKEEAKDRPGTEELEKLQERAAEGRRRIEAIVRYTGKMEERAEIDTRRQTVEAEHAKLDGLVKLLGPKGIRQGLSGGGGIEAFQAGINEHLKALGFQVDLAPLLALEDDAHVNGIATRNLSSSQRIRFGLCFQIAMASATGFGFVAVDDFDRLDSFGRMAAFKLLSECGHQVLILGTISETVGVFQAQAAQRNATGRERWALVGPDGIQVPVAEGTAA